MKLTCPRPIFAGLCLLISLLPGALAQTYHYDAAGRLTRAVYPQGGGVSYVYDDADNLLRAILLQVPSAPADVSAVRTTATSARISWPRVTGVTGYVIERRQEGSSEWTQIAVVGSAETSYVDTTLMAGVNYVYRMAGRNADGNTAYSNEAGFDTLSKPLIRETNGVLNGASFAAGPIAPGGIVSIFGSNLGQQRTEFGVGPLTAVTGPPPLGTTLGGYSVEIGGRPAPLYFVGSGQINAQVPWLTEAGQREVIVRQVADGETLVSDPYEVSVAAVSPALFTFDGAGEGKVVAVNVSIAQDDGVLNGSVAQPVGAFEFLPSEPAPRGGVIILYATGLGVVTPTVADGADSFDTLRETTIPLEVFIGGVRAQVLFSGLAPAFPGVNQLNVEIPAGAVPGGAVPIRLVQAGRESKPGVTIAIR